MWTTIKSKAYICLIWGLLNKARRVSAFAAGAHNGTLYRVYLFPDNIKCEVPSEEAK